MKDQLNEFIITGTVKEISPIVDGEGKNGSYKLRYAIIAYETLRYKNTIRICLWDILTETMEINDQVKIKFAIEIIIRPNNGLYFNSISAYHIINITKRTIATKKKISPIKNFIHL